MINTLMLKAIVSAQNGIARLRDEEEAQTLTEYALIIAVIAIGVLVAMYFLSVEKVSRRPTRKASRADP